MFIGWQKNRLESVHRRNVRTTVNKLSCQVAYEFDEFNRLYLFNIYHIKPIAYLSSLYSGVFVCVCIYSVNIVMTFRGRQPNFGAPGTPSRLFFFFFVKNLSFCVIFTVIKSVINDTHGC